MQEPDHPKRPLPETDWSLLRRAKASDAMVRQEALAALLMAYAPALRGFLLGVRRVPPDLVDDLVQGFIADKILSLKLVHHADRGRGRFRNLILKALSNYVSTRLEKEHRSRATGGGLDEARLRAAPAGPDVDRFDREWLQQVVREALASMDADCRERGRGDVWQIFQRRVGEPMLRDTEPTDYETLVRELGIASPREAMNLLATAKRTFHRHLRLAIGRYAPETQVDDEIADLRRVLAR